MPLRKVWKREYRKKQNEFRGHCKVGIPFSLFFSPISTAQRVVLLVALNGPGGFPRADGFKFPGDIPGGLHGPEEGSNVEEVE